MIHIFPTPQELDIAYRTEALKACVHWKPIVEQSIERSIKKIEEIRSQARDRRKLFTSDLFLVLRYELGLLKRKRFFLAFIVDQHTRLQKEEPLVMTLKEFREHVYWKNEPVN